jgi:hypothetical protein
MGHRGVHREASIRLLKDGSRDREIGFGIDGWLASHEAISPGELTPKLLGRALLHRAETGTSQGGQV